MTYFGNSVTEIYKTQEDYKPVHICVHYCQIPIYTAVMPDFIQLQIIFTLMYIESMLVCSLITLRVVSTMPNFMHIVGHVLF